MKDNIDRRLLFGAKMFLIPPAALLILFVSVSPLMEALGCQESNGSGFWHRCEVAGLEIGYQLELLQNIAVWGWIMGAPSAIIAITLLIVWVAVRLLMLRDRLKS